MQTQDSELILDEQQSIQMAQRIKEAREYLGLSQEFVAEKIGISRPAFSALETAKRKISGLELKKLAKLLKKPMDYFFDDEEILGANSGETVQALYRTSKDLSPEDQQQVLKFAQFLRQAGRPPGQRNGENSGD